MSTNTNARKRNEERRAEGHAMSAPEPVLSEEDLADMRRACRCSLCRYERTGGHREWIAAVEAIVARHVAAERERREQAERRHDPRCISLTDSDFNGGCDCLTFLALALDRAEKAERKHDALAAGVAALADEFRGHDLVVSADGTAHIASSRAAERLTDLLTDPSAALRAVRADEYQRGLDDRNEFHCGDVAHGAEVGAARALHEAADDLRQGRLGLDHHEQAAELDARADRIEGGENQ